MSLRSIALALLTATSSLALGCGEATTDAPVGQGEYRWGLLNEDSLVPDAPQYLVNKARGARAPRPSTCPSVASPSRSERRAPSLSSSASS